MSRLAGAILSISSGLVLLASARLALPAGPVPGTLLRQAEQTSLIIHFKRCGNLIFVPVRVNGSEELSFLLDTGAQFPILSARSAKRLGLSVESQHEDEVGTGEGKVTIGFTKKVTLKIHDLEMAPKQIAVIPLERLESHFGRSIDGVLGTDFFKQFVAEIDYLANVLTLYDQKTYVYMGDGDTVEIKLIGNRPFVKTSLSVAEAESVEALLAIATGDASAFSLHAPFVERHKLLSAVKTAPRYTSGIDGEAKEFLGRVGHLKLGRFDVLRPVTAFSQAKKGSTASTGYDGAIGGEILRRFKVTFDYSRKQMMLEPNPGFGEPYEADMIGASMVTASPDFGVFRITHVYAPSPAADAGLREGDLISTIDGKAAAYITLYQLEALFKEAGARHTLGIKRDDGYLSLTITLQRLI